VRLTPSYKSLATRWFCEKGPDNALSQVVLVHRTLCNRTPGGLGQHPAELGQLGAAAQQIHDPRHDVKYARQCRGCSNFTDPWGRPHWVTSGC
jgi:hypothetical protein